MNRLAEPGVAPGTLHRFGRVSRIVHWSVAMLVIVCVATAAILYNGSLAVLIGHRRIVELIHVYDGFALPAPLILGAFSSAYRTDLRRLNRFTPSDWRWLRSRTRRDGSIRVGKFNAGQKLNASLSAGAIMVLFGTGVIMYYPHLARLSWRSGATFVHDWFALALGLLVLGHIGYALKDAEALRGIRTGEVSMDWARAQHRAWADETTARPGVGAPTAGPVSGPDS